MMAAESPGAVLSGGVAPQWPVGSCSVVPRSHARGRGILVHLRTNSIPARLFVLARSANCSCECVGSGDHPVAPSCDPPIRKTPHKIFYVCGYFNVVNHLSQSQTNCYADIDFLVWG